MQDFRPSPGPPSRRQSGRFADADSDVLLVSATLPGVQQLQVAVVPTRRDGITVNDDWDNMGQRQTDSGSVSFTDVLVQPSELLGPPGAGGSPLATLRTCVTQSILSNIFIGVGQGALQEAAAYTRKLERPFFGSAASSATPWSRASNAGMDVVPRRA